MSGAGKPAFYAMPLRVLAAWVAAENGKHGCEFDSLPTVDDLEDDEEAEVRDEYEAMAEELWYAGQ